jgi:peptidoglycan/xylan/chitin deacetylase (PgdA/CDA1 family)
MTTQTNEKAVAEFYWTLRAIKEATGVTPKCWRPPQGDVDDRIRSIAWQMGLHTVIWDKDTDDWDMPAPGGGDLAPAKVDAKFEKWIAQEKAGNQTHGTIVLEHELNHATVEMTEKWLPKVKQVFNVVPALGCNDVTEPYWETSFKYPSIHNATS